MTLTDIVLIVLVVGVIGAVIKFWPKKMPKERAFRCRRCKAIPVIGRGMLIGNLRMPAAWPSPRAAASPW